MLVSNALNLRIATCTFCFILLIAARLSTTPVQAQPNYSITTVGLLWSDPRIQINIPSSPAILSEDLPQAMAIWNHAISWFKSTYYPMDQDYYSFISNPESAGITFQAVDLHTLQGYCSISGGIDVCTRYFHYTGSSYITNAYVEILASDLTASSPDHLPLVVTALGTLIGLIGIPQPCAFQDLMCASSHALYPSTLDLYAVRLLSQGDAVTNVTLPPTIPYQQAPALPVPEFQGTPILVTFVALCSTLTILRLNRRECNRHA